MHKRTIYAHWLDPEYTSFRWPEMFVRRRLQYICEVLKLRAILGDTIYLSDVQATDSRAVLELFCDNEFVGCMKAKPDFLRLVAHPTGAFGARDQTLQVIESALGRMLRPTWGSSTFRDSALPKALAQWVNKQRPADAEAFADVIEKFQPAPSLGQADTRLLAGMIAALKYFAAPTSQVFPPQPPRPGNRGPTHFDEVLMKAEADPNLDPYFRTHLQSTLQFIQKVNSKVPHVRAPVVHALADAGLDKSINYMHLSHVIQAWNLAVSGTVQPGGQDAPRFWRAVPIPVLHRTIAEMTVPGVNVTTGEQELFEGFNHHWHPADLSWGQIALVRKECSKIIEEFQRSQSASLRRKLLECAGKLIAESGRSTPSLLVSAEGGLAGELFGTLRKGSRFTQKSIGLVPAPVRLAIEVGTLLLSPALSVPVDIGDWLLQCAEWELKRREAKKITETIEAQMVRYNLVGEEN